MEELCELAVNYGPYRPEITSLLARFGGQFALREGLAISPCKCG